MAVTVKLDRIEGNVGRKTDKGWENLTRIAIVEGLSATFGYQRIHEAVLALFNIHGITIGTVHPEEPTAFLRLISPETMTPTTIILRLVYKVYPFQTPTLSVGGAVQQEQTNQDFIGNDIELSYTYPIDYPEQERANTTETTGVIITKFVPRVTVNEVRQEFFDLDGITPITHNIILNRSKRYQGTVNRDVWNIDPVALPNQWLCTTLSGRTIDGGVSYQVTYRFIHNPNFWNAKVVFIDPNTGKPAKNLVEGVSKADVIVYEERNFNPLNL